MHEAGLRIAENEGAQASNDLPLLGSIDNLCHLGSKGLCSTSVTEHGDHTAGECNQNNQRCISAERGDHIVRDNFDKTNQRVKAVHHCGPQPNRDE